MSIDLSKVTHLQFYGHPRLPANIHVARSPARRWNITLKRVIHHHPVSIEPPAQGANRPLHALDPPARQPIPIALIEQRNHFLAQYPIQILSVARIVNLHVRMRSPRADREPVQSVVSLCPPPI